MKNTKVWMPCTKEQYEEDLESIIESIVIVGSRPCYNYPILYFREGRTHSLGTTSLWNEEKDECNIVIDNYDPKKFLESCFDIKYYNDNLIYY